MPLQNRVDPFGALNAVAARGTLMGNRGGRIHRPDQTLGRRRWVSRAWICCELEWRGHHHEPMGAGYTSLFFLDEVTALAAGHRPCFYCRRADAVRFRSLAGAGPAPQLDRVAHAERRVAQRTPVNPADLPDGTMVQFDGRPWAVRGSALLAWTFTGYRSQRAMPGAAELLTPPIFVAALRAGYQPRWHQTGETRT